MNCDDVFVILTRGPFPTGARTDSGVEAHLQVCPECQRLAAALRPNERGSPDAVEPEESRHLPGYWGTSLESSGELAISLSDAVSSPRAQRLGLQRQQVQMGKNLNVWQFAAAVALGIVLAAALRTLVTVHTQTASAADPGLGALMMAPATTQAQRAEARWAMCDLNPMCRPQKPIRSIEQSFSSGEQPLSLTLDESPASAAVNCCTQCHRADSNLQISSRAVLRLQKTCIGCHDRDGDSQ
jgi:hypothetical protein